MNPVVALAELYWVYACVVCSGAAAAIAIATWDIWINPAPRRHWRG